MISKVVTLICAIRPGTGCCQQGCQQQSHCLFLRWCTCSIQIERVGHENICHWSWGCGHSQWTMDGRSFQYATQSLKPWCMPNCKNHELSLIRPGPCTPTEVWGWWALRRGPLRLGPGGVARVGLPNHSHCRSFQLYSVVEQCWHDMHDSMWLRPGMGRTRARRTGRGGACHTIQVGVRTCLPWWATSTCLQLIQSRAQAMQWASVRNLSEAVLRAHGGPTGDIETLDDMDAEE